MENMQDSCTYVAVINSLRGFGLIVPRISDFIKKRDVAMAKSTSTSYFRMPLDKVMDLCPIRKGDLILPRFFVEIAEKLQSDGNLGSEGLFRVNGTNARMSKLEAAINEGLPLPSTCIVHDLTGVLKQFLRELPDPLLTHWLYPVFIEAHKLRNPADRLRAVLLLCLLLPKAHLHILMYLTNLLNLVVSYPGSKMTAQNLSAIFTPNILRPLDGDVKTMKRASVTTELELANHQQSVGVVELLINNFKDIGKVPPDISASANSLDVMQANDIMSKLRHGDKKKSVLCCCAGQKEEEQMPFAQTKPVASRGDDRRTSKATLELIQGNQGK